MGGEPILHRPGTAALAFAEAVAHQADTHVPTEIFDALAEHYGADQIAAIVSLLVAVTAWNTVGVSTRTGPVAPTTDRRSPSSAVPVR